MTEVAKKSAKATKKVLQKAIPTEFFKFGKKDVPIIFKEEFAKPWFFYNVSIPALNQNLHNGAPKNAVVRNHDKWPSTTTDINRIRFECSFLAADGSAIEQYMIIKERVIAVDQLPSSDAPVMDAVADGLASAKRVLGKLVLSSIDAVPQKVFEFEYYFDHDPSNRHADIELLMKSASLKPLMAHHWRKHSFRRPVTCAQCNKFIWGIVRQGHQCRVCLKPSHTRCYTIVPPHCPGVPMSKAERRDRAIRKVWSKFDADGNGSLSYGELTRHLGMTDTEAQLFISAYDRDQNMRIDFDEFVELIYKHFLKAFRQFDRNDDGEITPKELKEGFKDLGMSVSKAELLKYLDDMDENDDGVITLDEFIDGCFITVAVKAAQEELEETRRIASTK